MRRSAESRVTGSSNACRALAIAVALQLGATAAQAQDDPSFKIFGATYSAASDERVELLVRNCDLGTLTGRVVVFLITGVGPRVEVASQPFSLERGVYLMLEPLPVPNGARTASYVEIQAAPSPCTVPGNPPVRAALAISGPTGDTRLLLELPPAFISSYSTGGTDGDPGRQRGFGFISLGPDETPEAVIHHACGLPGSVVTYTFTVQNISSGQVTETMIEVPAEWGAKVALNGAQAGWNAVRVVVKGSDGDDALLNSPCRSADTEITLLSADPVGQTQIGLLLPGFSGSVNSTAEAATTGSDASRPTILTATLRDRGGDA